MKTEEKKEKKRTLPKGITRCGDGRYQARYTLDGHRYCIYGRDIAELERRLIEERYERENGIYAKPEKITVEEWFNIWMRDYKATTVKQGTLESYQCMFDYYIKGRLGKKEMEAVKGAQIQEFYNDMSKNRYSKSTISLIHVLLGSMFKQAVKNEIIDKNPVEITILPRGIEKKEKRVLSQEEQKLLLAECKGSKIRDVILFALATGMRIGEIIGIEWGNINFERREITVIGTLKQPRKGECYKDTPKTLSSRRIVPMLPQLSDMLHDLRIRQLQQKKKMGKEWKVIKSLEGIVFTRENGRPFTGQYVRQQLIHIVDQINLKYPNQYFEYVTPHALRHTFATRALENEMPPKVVQEILGHSSITMTLDLYTHVLQQTKINEMKKLEKLF